MGRRKKGTEAADAGGKSRRGNLVPALIIAVGLLGGAKLMGGSGGAGVSGATQAATTTTVVEDGPVTKLDPLTLNLSDGRFLRVGMAFELAPDAEAAAEGEGTVEPDSSDAAGHYAKALDIVISVLGRRTYEQLVTPAGRLEAKSEVLDALDKAYAGEIKDLLFTEFVLQ